MIDMIKLIYNYIETFVEAQLSKWNSMKKKKSFKRLPPQTKTPIDFIARVSIISRKGIIS